MARVLGYGGIANTNGARDFSGKAENVSGNQPEAPQFIQTMIMAFLSVASRIIPVVSN